MEYVITFEDGTRERLEAAKYDHSLGIFRNAAGNAIGYVNKSKVKLIKVVTREQVKEEAQGV